MSREKPDSSSGGGLQIQTLLLSAVSAVAAATIVPLFWERGTVIATAMTPIVVALVTEALRRPVERVRAVAPRVTATRRATNGTAVRSPARVPSDAPGPPDAPFVPPGGVSPEDPFGLRRPARRSWWKLGLLTGVLAFVLGAGVVTASELTIFGGSVSGDRGRTTLFGGSTKKHATDRESGKEPAATPSPAATATPRATASPTATPQLQASPTATPTVSPTPTPTVQGAAPQATPTP